MSEGMELIPVQTIDAVALFANGGIRGILSEIEAKALSLVPDVSTAKGRKEIASMAYKVAQSKTFLDAKGKDLVADWKEKSKRVDDERRFARDFLDGLKERVREPLTAWEAAEAARIEAERLAKELAEAEEAAYAEHSIFIREQEIARKEAEIARIEAEKKAKEEAERIARERAEREKRIAEEAAARAKKEAEEYAKRVAEAAAQRERERIEAAERAKRQAEESAAKAERDRIAAEERAKIEAEQARIRQERAVKEAEERARQEAESKERERLAKEAAEKAEAERKAANKKHQARINNEAVAGFVANGIVEDQAKAIVILIASGKIQHVSIRY